MTRLRRSHLSLVLLLVVLSLLAPALPAIAAARPTVAAPIASATRVEQFAESAKFVDLELTADQVRRLDAASSH